MYVSSANLNNCLLKSISENLNHYESFICNPINVSGAKKIKIIHPGCNYPIKIDNKNLEIARELYRNCFPKIITVARLDKRKSHQNILMTIKNLKPRFNLQIKIHHLKKQYQVDIEKNPITRLLDLNQ